VFGLCMQGDIKCERLRELLGMGIFAVDGHLWKEQRRVTSYEFSSGALRELSTVVFREYACKLVSILAHFASTGDAVDLQVLNSALSIRFVSQVARTT
jgi:hypothetical protein